MKVRLIGISLLICVAFACPTSAQTNSLQTDRPASPTLETAMANEDPAARISTLQQFLKTRPAAEEADAAREAIVASWAQLGETQLNENNIEKAAANFRKSVAALPEKITDRFFAETVIRIPLAVSVRGYRAEAIELARQLEKRFAKEAPRMAALGEFFMTIEAPTDAIRALEAAAKLADEDARLHNTLGAAYRMGLRLDDAIAEYQLAIGADPQSKRSYYELANLYRAHGAYTDAVKLYQKQIEIEPKHAPALKGLALSYLAQGNDDQMIAALNRARDLRGSAEEVNADLYLQTQMAFYYLKQGKLKQARQASEAALTVEPRYAWARIAAAEVDLAEGKLFEAERNLLAAQRYATFPTLFFTFGKLYLSVEDFDGAVEQFAKAFRFSPKQQFTTRLGGTLDVKADGVKELLSREHQASIFVAEPPTQPEQFKLAESLVRFNVWLNEIKTMTAAGKNQVTRQQMEELDRAAMDFVEAESTRRSFRSLYVAQKLSQAGIATGLAVELAEQALGLAEAATEFDGSLKDYPNYDRAGRLQIFRGRALDAKGWSLFKAGRNEEAIASLNEAVKAYGSLPEGKRALWHLATVKETAGDLNAALELYIAGYEPQESNSTADVKLAVIEILYRKVNGSLEGLNKRLGITTEIASTPPSKSASLPAPSSREKQSANKSDKPAALLKLQPKSKPTREVAPDNAQAATIEPVKALPVEPAAIEPIKEVAKEPAKEEVVKTELSAPVMQPVELPQFPTTSDQPIPLTPLLDAQTALSPKDAIKLDSADEEVPPPPVKQNSRPRRVVLPQTPKAEAEPKSEETEPKRLRRPPPRPIQ